MSLSICSADKMNVGKQHTCKNRNKQTKILQPVCWLCPPGLVTLLHSENVLLSWRVGIILGLDREETLTMVPTELPWNKEKVFGLYMCMEA